MTERQFTREIFRIPYCEDCPIKIFCSLYACISCTRTARDYYRTHGKERITWEELGGNLHQIHTTPKF